MRLLPLELSIQFVLLLLSNSCQSTSTCLRRAPYLFYILYTCSLLCSGERFSSGCHLSPFTRYQTRGGDQGKTMPAGQYATPELCVWHLIYLERPLRLANCATKSQRSGWERGMESRPGGDFVLGVGWTWVAVFNLDIWPPIAKQVRGQLVQTGLAVSLGAAHPSAQFLVTTQRRTSSLLHPVARPLTDACRVTLIPPLWRPSIFKGECRWPVGGHSGCAWPLPVL